MAVPRPVLLAILGLALCVTALVAFRGVGGGDDDAIAPAPIPTAPVESGKSTSTQPGARGRARTRPRVDRSAPAKPAENAGSKADVKPDATKLSKPQRTELRSKAQLAGVSKALAQKDVVVLFFSRPGAADD